jgi:proline iminopeptidase
MRIWALVLLAALACVAKAQPLDGTILRPGARLHFRSVGVGSPLVILAGGPGQDVRQLSGVVERIKDLRRCVLFDQRATGRSTVEKLGPDSINLEAYIADLEALRKEVKLSRMSLLGHSWGAMLALAYAVRHPGHVDELVLIDSGPIAVESFKLLGDVLAHRRALMDVQGELKEDQDLFELRPFFFDQKKAEEFAQRPRDGEVATPVSQWIIPDLQKRGFDLREGAKKLRCRTLIIQGRFDAMPESLVLEANSCILGSKLVFIERAGHFPWIEQPERFGAVLRSFLRGD